MAQGCQMDGNVFGPHIVWSIYAEKIDHSREMMLIVPFAEFQHCKMKKD
jgi:hypothetical protein